MGAHLMTDRGTSAVRVSALYVAHGHHSPHSGYPRFLDRLNHLAELRRPRPWPLPRQVLERASDRIVYEWFGTPQLQVDLTAAQRLITSRDEVVHLLYGETDHFYAGRLPRMAARRGNRLVATFHQPPAVIDELWPAPPLFEQLDHAIALGPSAALRLSALMGAGRVSEAFLGVDTHAWRPAPAARAAEPTCCFVGSWFRDLEVLRGVIALVGEAEPRMRFEVVTSPGHARELRSLPRVRARAGIAEPELRSVYQRSWVHVLPLSDSVANNALLEGMACGVPTVVTDVGDASAYTGAAALLAPPGDAAAMARAVLELIEDEPARDRLGLLARARAEALDLDAAARRHAEIYRLQA
jgi:glycosyltransferase involved in cell wall biosynthesis